MAFISSGYRSSRSIGWIPSINIVVCTFCDTRISNRFVSVTNNGSGDNIHITVLISSGETVYSTITTVCSILVLSIYIYIAESPLFPNRIPISTGIIPHRMRIVSAIRHLLDVALRVLLEVDDLRFGSACGELDRDVVEIGRSVEIVVRQIVDHRVIQRDIGVRNLGIGVLDFIKRDPTFSDCIVVDVLAIVVVEGAVLDDVAFVVRQSGRNVIEVINAGVLPVNHGCLGCGVLHLGARNENFDDAVIVLLLAVDGKVLDVTDLGVDLAGTPVGPVGYLVGGIDDDFGIRLGAHDRDVHGELIVVVGQDRVVGQHDLIIDFALGGIEHVAIAVRAHDFPGDDDLSEGGLRHVVLPGDGEGIERPDGRLVVGRPARRDDRVVVRGTEARRIVSAIGGTQHGVGDGLLQVHADVVAIQHRGPGLGVGATVAVKGALEGDGLGNRDVEIHLGCQALEPDVREDAGHVAPGIDLGGHHEFHGIAVGGEGGTLRHEGLIEGDGLEVIPLGQGGRDLCLGQVGDDEDRRVVVGAVEHLAGRELAPAVGQARREDALVFPGDGSRLGIPVVEHGGAGHRVGIEEVVQGDNLVLVAHARRRAGLRQFRAEDLQGEGVAILGLADGLPGAGCRKHEDGSCEDICNNLFHIPIWLGHLDS